MGRTKKSLRDASRISGKPLLETLIPSPVLGRASTSDSTSDSNPTPGLNSNPNTPDAHEQPGWVTSPDLAEHGLPYALEDIRDTTLFLMQNPGLTSTVLFRADVLFDSGVDESHSHSQQSTTETVTGTGTQQPGNEIENAPLPARQIPGFELRRMILRRLVPRNSQLDSTVDQTCHAYLSKPAAEIEVEAGMEGPGKDSGPRRFLIIYTPHVSSREELPYYHPQLRALGLMYEVTSSLSPSGLGDKDPSAASGPNPCSDPYPEQEPKNGTLSVHFLPYPPQKDSITPRLQRSLSNLLEVQIRLTKGRLNTVAPTTQSPYAAIKDNVIPRARVQDSYSRLKIKYASDLCERWVESTEPSKHVYEDLGIAAFLVEVWRDIYGVQPGDEREEGQQGGTGEDGSKKEMKGFPGFVDIACGNGVLVYILLSEGYPGYGFDARRRKTWSIFPDDVQKRLKKEIYIPGPFTGVLEAGSQGSNGLGSSLESSLRNDTFIISNHADELTLWTPLLATLLNPSNPPPFLAIPCCSHSLSGARHRYPPQTQSQSQNKSPQSQTQSQNEDESKGDLKSLRATKLAAQNPSSAAFATSTYGALTDKLIAVSNEVGIETIRTLLRIPSTRNIGVLGGVEVSRGGVSLRAGGAREANGDRAGGEEEDEEDVLGRLFTLVERECVRDGGINLAARNWVERARGLMAGGGSAHAHT